MRKPACLNQCVSHSRCQDVCMLVSTAVTLQAEGHLPAPTSGGQPVSLVVCVATGRLPWCHGQVGFSYRQGSTAQRLHPLLLSAPPHPVRPPLPRDCHHPAQVSLQQCWDAGGEGESCSAHVCVCVSLSALPHPCCSLSAPIGSSRSHLQPLQHPWP